jgi:regulator of replication initiation timing
MPQKFLTKIKVDKANFLDVAKQAKMTGLTTKKFRDKAMVALRQAKYGSATAKSIISGYKKMEQAGLKRVFSKLKQAKVIKKGPDTVTKYIQKEKNKQVRLIRQHLRERADEITKEKKAEQEVNKSGEKKDTAVPLAGSGFSLTAGDTLGGQTEHSAATPQVILNKPKEEILPSICLLCGQPMVIKEDSKGKFLVCSNYPVCQNIKPLAGPQDAVLPKKFTDQPEKGKELGDMEIG